MIDLDAKVTSMIVCFITNTEGWFASLVDHGKVRGSQVFTEDVTSVVAFFATPPEVVCISVCPYNEG